MSKPYDVIEDLGYCPECGATKPAQQEPVSFLDWYDNAHWGNEDFKAGCWRAWDAALAQRTWIGLTDEEVQAAVYDENGCVVDYENYAEAIEAKLKERNT